MQHRFFALISRMRYIGRWGLMRNTFEENIQEHSHMVAVLAHGLAVIQRDILGQPADPDRCASAALFHDASEILTGDLPTPIKYYNPEIKKAYKQIEAVSCEKLLALLPPEVQESYRPLLFESDPDIARIVKAADKLSAYIKCVEELKAGNSEFAAAEKQTRQALVDRADARGVVLCVLFACGSQTRLCTRKDRGGICHVSPPPASCGRWPRAPARSACRRAAVRRSPASRPLPAGGRPRRSARAS